MTEEETSHGRCTPSRSSFSQSAYSRSYTAGGEYGDSFYDNDELELELNEDRDAALVEQMLSTVDAILYAQDPTSQHIAEKQIALQCASDDSSFLSDAPLRNPHRKPLQSYAAECLQWGQAFHHLRIEGKIMDVNTATTQATMSQVSNSRTRSRGSRSDKSNPTSPTKARFTASPSVSDRNFTVDPSSVASLQIQGTRAQIVLPVFSSSTSDSEEILAIDGAGCEEMMAIDRTADDDEAMLFVHIELDRKRQSQQKRDIPPVTPTRLNEYEDKQGKIESWWQSFAHPSIVTPLVQRVVDVLTNAAASQHTDSAPAPLTIQKPPADEDEEVLFFDGDAAMPNPFSPKSPAQPRFKASTLHAFDLLQLDQNGKLKAKKRPIRSSNHLRVGDSSSRSLLSDRSRASRPQQSTILPADFDFGEDSMSDPLSYHSPSHHSAYSITQSSRRVEQNPLSRSNSRLTHRGALALDPTSPPRFSESDSSDSEGEQYVSAKESSRIAPLPPSALNPANLDQRAIRTPNLGSVVMPISPHHNANSTPPPPQPLTAGKHVTVAVPSKQQPSSPFRPASRNSPASSTATRPQSSQQLSSRNLPSSIRSHQLNSYALVAESASPRSIAVDSNIHVAASISRTQSATYSRGPLVPQVLPLSLGQPALLSTAAATLAQTMPMRSAAPSIRLPSVASAIVQTSPMKSSAHLASLAYSNSPSALHQRPHSVASIRSSSNVGAIAYPRAVLQALDGSHTMASRSSTAARRTEGISPAVPMTLQVQNGHLRMSAAPISTPGASVAPSTNGIARAPRAVSALPRSYQLSTPSLASDHQLLSNSHSLKKLHSLPMNAGPIVSTDISNSRPQSVSMMHRSSASIDSPFSSLGSGSSIVYDFAGAKETSHAPLAGDVGFRAVATGRNNNSNHGKVTKISSSKPIGSTSTPTQRKFNRLTSGGPIEITPHHTALHQVHPPKTRHTAILPSGSRQGNPAPLSSKHKLSVRVPASLALHNSMEQPIPSQTVAH